jgi:dTDP-L-rhamnose 4-epimerase
MNKHNPVIFEDGRQSRDFIHVDDIVKANILAMEKKEADFEVFNVGSGKPITVLEIAQILIKKINPSAAIKPDINKQFREGDIRHCFADITKIKKVLGFKPSINFEDGIGGLVAWVKSQTCEDRVTIAIEELTKRGLAT